MLSQFRGVVEFADGADSPRVATIRNDVIPTEHNQGEIVEVGLMSLGDLLPHPVTGLVETERARHRSLVAQAVLAEELGFSSVHLGEHHFCDYMLSSPPVVLAAIGERTSTIKLSTSVTLAGNLDPVRVAEDYATVDVLSDGRVELVLGRGNLFPQVYEGFGQPVSTARRRFAENVTLLTRLLREELVTWTGEFRSPLDALTTRPRPAATMPIWVGAASRGSVELAADLGCALMLPGVFGRPEFFRPIVERYRDRWESSGRNPGDARVGTCSHIYVRESRQQARKEWEPHYRNYWAFVATLLGDSSAQPAFDFDELLAGPAMCGSPQDVVDSVGVWHDLLGIDRHLFMFDLGGIDNDSLNASINLFGAEVLPHLSAM